MLVVARVEFDEHGVVARGEVTLHDFGNLEQFGCRLLVHRAALQGDAHVGACAVADGAGVDVISRAGDDAGFGEALHALMNGSARHAANLGHVLEGHAGIHGDNLKDFQIQFVYFLHDLFCLLKAKIVLDLRWAKIFKIFSDKSNHDGPFFLRLLIYGVAPYRLLSQRPCCAKKKRFCCSISRLSSSSVGM